MAVDPYAQCPCGSGKKLKFCCSDLIGEIEKIHQMVSGNQPQAALKHVEQLLLKQPDRSSLLEIKATLEISLEEFKAAEETIVRFLVCYPDDPSPHAQSAILTAATKGGEKAIAPLQNALERTTDDMPRRVFEAIGAVGHALLSEGDIFAARAHLMLYAGIAPKEDNRALDLLMRINAQSGLPLIMRDHQVLMEPAATAMADDTVDDTAAWIASFEEASRLAARGLWRRAEQTLAKLGRTTRHPQPAVVYNLALLRGWLGQDADLAAGLHRFATLDVPLDNAVEAEALAQLIDPESEEPTIDTVRVVYPIQDIAALARKFATDSRIEDYEVEPDQFDDEEINRPREINKPRASYVLLDRPLPKSGVDLARENAPHVVGFLSIFGKRTDRQAQLELVTDRNDRFDEVTQLLGDVADGVLGDDFPESLEEEVIGDKSLDEVALSWRWRIPNDTPIDHRRKLIHEERRDAILNRWPHVARAALEGKTPQTVSSDGDSEAGSHEHLRIPLLASVLNLELTIDDPSEQPIIQQLRQQLKLPPSETIELADIDVNRIPLARVPRLNLKIISDDKLVLLLNRSVMVNASTAALVVAKELTGRETVSKDVDLAVAFRQLIRLTPDPKQALTSIQQARAWSEENNRSTAEWAVHELELQIELGDITQLQRVLDEIRNQHAAVPGVMESVIRILQSHGLLAPPDTGQGDASQAYASQARMPRQAAQLPGASTTTPAGATKQLWTPGSQNIDSGKREAESREPPAIWTPS